jgi:uncharacterized protein (UPF0276 family)
VADLIEVIADDYFEASRSDLRALRTLAAQVSVVLHGVSLGLASTLPIERRRLERIARLGDWLKMRFQHPVEARHEMPSL